MIQPPEHLTDEAADAWRELQSQLPAPLEPADAALFEVAACSLANYRAASASLSADGMIVWHEGRCSANPAARILQASAGALADMGKRFGWSPLDRRRMKIQKEEPKPENPMARFFNPAQHPRLKIIPKKPTPAAKKKPTAPKTKKAANG